MAEVVFNPHQAPHLYGTARPLGLADFCGNEAVASECNDTGRQDWFSFPASYSDASLPSMVEPSAPISRSTPPYKAETISRSHTRAINSTSSLPPFRFNPSASTEPSPRESESTRQPIVSAPTTPVRAGRHRRTASEFIGGNVRPDPSSYRSGSPDNNWIGSSSRPTISSFGSLPSRLEAGHRRTISSQRIPLTEQSILLNSHGSIDDLSVALPQPVIEPPLNRSDATSLKSPFPFTTPRVRHTTMSGESSPAPRSSSRARVGFSETLEFIPRPLSTISSESGSSLSTIRGHSMSGSISSVLCQAAGSPLSKTLGDASQSEMDNGHSPLRARSTSPGIGLGHARTSSTLDNSSLPQRPTSAGPCLDGTRSVGTGTLPQDQGQLTASRPNGNNGESSQPRKVGHWAALLGRRTRTTESIPKESGETAVASTPLASVDCFSGADLDPLGPVELSEDFDTDPTSMIIALPQHLDFSTTQTPPLTPTASWRFNENPHGAGASTMIDLDIALGPQSILLDSGHESEGSKVRKVVESRRSMRSSNVSSGFFAAGFHRRADSAPSHVPVNFDAANFRERNSSTPSFKRSQMEDVFEEDEDDSAGTALPYGSSAPSMASREGLGIGMETTDTASTGEANGVHDYLSEPPIGLNNTTRILWMNPQSTGHLTRQDDIGIAPASQTVEILDNDASRAGADYFSSNSSAFMEIPSGAKISNHPGIEALSLPNRPIFTPVPWTGSPLLSTSCGCESECVHGGRRNTSTSFSTDVRKFHTHAFGDQGSDLRYSVDDVPSLISSRSTMTNQAHARAPSTSSRGFAPRSTSSSLSLSSAMERRKRSSIVSLSRFVGGPFAEKNRQVLEPGKRWQSPLSAKDEKPPKSSRLSRLFKFWKPKESSP